MKGMHLLPIALCRFQATKWLRLDPDRQLRETANLEKKQVLVNSQTFYGLWGVFNNYLNVDSIGVSCPTRRQTV